MSALMTAKKLGREAILEKVKEADLYTYGLKREAFADYVQKAVTSTAIDAGLDNADTDGILLNLLRENPVRVFEGMGIAAYLIETKEITLYLPEAEKVLADKLKEIAAQYQIEIVNDIIDVRKSQEHLFLHMVTALELADIAEDNYESGVYVSVDQKTLQKVKNDTGISELVSMDGAKALWMGYRYFTPEEATEKTAVEASNAVIEVLTDNNCMVQETLKRLKQFRNVSCGKCVFCREGLIQLEYMQKEITAAHGKMDYLDLTQEIGNAMCHSTLCSIGQESAKAALDATTKYREEYETHIKKSKCQAHVCASFEHIYIDPQLCIGCGECMDVCPADCIEGKPNYIHMIDEFDCTKCGKCIEACGEAAIIQTAGKLPKLPNLLTKAGKFRKH